MKYHLDRRVVLSTESSTPNLYSWCLRELDDLGKPVGRDLIHWDGSQYFDATELSLVVSEGVKPDYASDSEDAALVHASTIISGVLTPEHDRRGMMLNPKTTYSMMGTNRREVAFRLVIRPATSNDPQTVCRAWGSPASTFELDFRNVTQEDEVVFDMTVSEATFAQYADMICAGAVSGGQLKVSGVRGFYSDWSPSISTDLVKVLTADPNSHIVEAPSDCTIQPPRLGQINDARFELVHKIALQTNTAAREDIEREDAEDIDITPRRQQPDSGSAALLKQVTSLQTTLWVATIVLFLAIVFN